MDSHLLPSADASPLCSDFAKSLGVRPAGTGLALDRIIVVAVPEPWPKPALNHPWLKPAAQALTASSVPSRLFAAEPWSADSAVELFERHGLGFRSYRWVHDDPADIVDIVASIARAAPGAHGMAPIEVTVPTMLVCTQGSHDECCGLFGKHLADRIEAERSAYRVRRVSHTGGHRFAPTFLALPSGRMWAYADLDLVDRVASGAETEADLVGYCRGWLGAPAGPAQVAELAVRAAAGNPFLAPPEIEVEALDDRFRCTVRVDDQIAVVDVRAGRNVPTIACGAPGGMPVKPGKEYDYTLLENPWN